MAMNSPLALGKSARTLAIIVAVALSGIVSGDAESAFTDGTNPVLSVNLISFDSAQGDIMARLRLKLPKSQITPQFSPLQDYTLVDELTINESVLKISATTPYSVFNNCLPTVYQVSDAGSQFLYPFDTHRAELRIFVDHTVLRHSIQGNVVENIRDEERAPLALDTSLCSFEGYRIILTPAPDNSATYVHLLVDLRRTLPIKLFTVFVSILMLLVSLGFMNMVRKLLRSSSAPDINELAFGAALLFAFPAIRSIEPFVPPMGVLSDFFGFFWAESIVAISLIIHLYCWMKRKRHD